MRKVPPGEFLEAWKRESDKHADTIFSSLWIDTPTISGELKEAAIESVMRVVWICVDAPDKADALRANRAAIRKYTSELVDKTVAEMWESLTPESRAVLERTAKERRERRTSANDARAARQTG